jgi:hypothetical protein
MTEPELAQATFGYLSMTALPASLRHLEPQARARYATGWRPPVPPGPGRDELAGIIEAAMGGDARPGSRHEAPEPALR